MFLDPDSSQRSNVSVCALDFFIKRLTGESSDRLCERGMGSVNRLFAKC
jgi:hypothetical protein